MLPQWLIFFLVRITTDSPPEFSVSPTVGMLDAYGSEGTNFVVSFTPKGARAGAKFVPFDSATESMCYAVLSCCREMAIAGCSRTFNFIVFSVWQVLSSKAHCGD